ncbi:hypothetical protein ACVBEF_19910 [Glaciimonas sp. GG7]
MVLLDDVVVEVVELPNYDRDFFVSMGRVNHCLVSAAYIHRSLHRLAKKRQAFFLSRLAVEIAYIASLYPSTSGLLEPINNFV